ncbi:Rubisco LSMT substrate-binding-domain-containing protein, partial [Dunaliella salina]
LGWPDHQSDRMTAGLHPSHLLTPFNAKDRELCHHLLTPLYAEDHELVGSIAAQSSELTALTLLLLAERAKGDSSPHSALFASLPLSVCILAGECLVLLLFAYCHAWHARSMTGVGQSPANMHLVSFSCPRHGTCVHMDVFSQLQMSLSPCCRIIFCFPQNGHGMNRGIHRCSMLVRGQHWTAQIDHIASEICLAWMLESPLRNGTEILISDPRPNSELILATGRVYPNNPSDFLLWKANLIKTDRYFLLKNQILESLGYGIEEEFPVYADRMPTQLLAYLRMARVQDPGLLAKVNFEKDVMLSDLNEYEILQILMGDCRERLQAYPLSVEEEIKYSQDPKLSPKQRLACQLRTEEKRIVSGTMDGVRNKLAPIRGIPTKQGLQNPNQDLLDIFAFWDSVPRLPQIVFGSIAS